MAGERALEILVDQAELVRRGSGISEGQLSLFRRALQLDDFSEVVQSVKLCLGRDLFSTYQEIESMEKDVIQGNRSDLTVQCCLILELAMNSTYLLDPRYMSYHRSTFFDHCRTLEEIAMLNSRLDFISPESDFQEMLAENIVVAVRDCVAQCAPTWRDIILVFETAVPGMDYPLLCELAEFIADELFEIPALPATLLLSFVADAVKGRGCRVGDIVARRLLALGASPMVSSDDHRSLLERINAKHLKEEPQPWWLKAQEPELERSEKGPTALSRLMGFNVSSDLRMALEQASCCNLDSSRERRADFPKKLISLRCLAARSLNVSDLTWLSGNLKFSTSKHVKPSR